MVCNAPIKKGDKLVAVPRKLWMTSVTARQSNVCKKLIIDNDLEAWQVLSFQKKYLLVTLGFFLQGRQPSMLVCSTHDHRMSS